jgi:hypothetical protein
MEFNIIKKESTSKIDFLKELIKELDSLYDDLSYLDESSSTDISEIITIRSRIAIREVAIELLKSI